MMEKLEVTLIIDGSTSDTRVLQLVLDAMEGVAGFHPTHWGPAEGVRRPYVGEEVVALVEKGKRAHPNFFESTVMFWRQKGPRFQASLWTTDASVARLRVTFAKPSGSRAPAYAAVAELAARLPLVWGGMQVWVRASDTVAGLTKRETAAVVQAVLDTPGALKELGPTRPCSRTWYGPLLAERIGRALLADLGATACGTALMLDLGPEPWRAELAELARLQEEPWRRLHATGMFRETEWSDEGVSVGRRPGPAWSPPPWVLRRADLPVARASDEARRLEVAPTEAHDAVEVLPPDWVSLRGSGRTACGGDVSNRDLRDIDISDVSVSDASFAGADLRGTTLRRFKAKDTDFTGANLAGANLTEAHVFGCRLSKARLENAVLVEATLATSELKGAVLDGANLTGANLMGAWLHGASLRGAVLAGAKLEKAVLRDADLTAADLRGCDLTGADLRGAVLADVAWTGATVTGAKLSPGVAPPDVRS